MTMYVVYWGRGKSPEKMEPGSLNSVGFKNKEKALKFIEGMKFTRSEHWVLLKEEEFPDSFKNYPF